jgi:ubiquinone/menaquinone biosynthesis C-methylase UbiE
VADRETRRLSFGSVAAEAEVLAGRGEDVPLPDASVDAAVISSAWQWLDPGRAVPEITRVLRAAGVLGVMWISRDMRVPWVEEFSRLARESREADRGPDDAAPRHRRRAIAFPPGTPMSPSGNTWWSSRCP